LNNKHKRILIMKKFALICLFASMAFIAGAQNGESKETPAHGAKIRFESLEHNYGTIQKGGNGDCEFTFTNEGDEPLILQTVRASCGCTTPSYTQKPVMPGQTGTIKVHYNTNNVGGFSKTVTVTSNAVNNPRTVLRIKGSVQQKEQSQPAQVGKPAEAGQKTFIGGDKQKSNEIKVVPASTSENKVKSDRKSLEKGKKSIEMTPERMKNMEVLNEGLKRYKAELNSGKMELSDEYVDAIKRLAEDMMATPELRIMATGHTCNTGSSETNMKVGMKRALAVKKMLAGYGVPDDRIIVQSKGDKEPAFSNDTEEGRMQNRRVVVEYVK